MMLNSRQLKQLAAVLPAFRNLCAALDRTKATNSDYQQLEYANYAKILADLFVNPDTCGVLIGALEGYAELDAALLDAQETNAELEETLEAANRDLESLIHYAPKVERGDYAALYIQ